MRQGPDLTGKKFGKLIVTGKSKETYIDKHGYKHTKWDCVCECGNKISVVTSSLTHGLSTSCGCGRIRDLTGQKFSMLTVIELDKTENDHRSNSAKWICKCDCGNIVSVWSQALTKGLQKSCGCYNKSSASKSNYVNLKGMKFGRLTVIKRMPKTLTSGGHQLIKYLCRCDCGNERVVDGGSLKDGTTQSCGCLNREISSRQSLIDFTNKTIDMITVLYRIDDYVKPSGGRVPKWFCKCKCGNNVELTSEQIKHTPYLSCGCVSYSRGEKRIAEELNKFGVQFEKEFSFPDLKGPNGGYLKFDFKIYDSDKNIILIEFQGVQHFENTPHLSSMQREITDPLKREYCKKHNIKLYEISYLDDVSAEIEKIVKTHIACQSCAKPSEKTEGETTIS